MPTPGMVKSRQSKIVSDPLPMIGAPSKLDYRRIAWFVERYIIVPKGVGARGPMKLRPWQKAMVKHFYPPTGPRPRTALVSIPRGNGKSTLAAALGLYGLLADDVEGAQVLIVASDERQARIVYNAARRMVELSPELARRVVTYGDRLYVPGTDSVMMPLPAEASALQGHDPSLMIIDELHVVTERVWDAVTLASGKRAQSLNLAISTPADNVNSIMWRLVEYGRANADDKAFRLIEYAAPEGCELDDREAWAIANPALGDFLAEDALAATMTTSREESFRRYRLGQWVGSANAWLPWGAWEKIQDSSRGLPESGTAICLGFDGSASGDSTVLIGATVEPEPYLFTVGIWERPEDAKVWRVPRAEVSSAVESAMKRYDVLELAADPWGWRSELEEWGTAYDDKVVQFNTSYASRMAPATDRLFTAIMERTVTHDGDERVAHHVSNTIARSSALGDIVSKDKRNSTRRIDATVAAIVAHDRAAWHQAHPKPRRRAVAF